MSAEIIIALGIAAIFGAAVLVLWYRFRARDFLLMAAVCFPLIWFSRFDHVPIFFLGQHIPAHWFVLLAIILVMLPLADRRTSAAVRPAFRQVLVPLAVLLLIMLVSILANAGSSGDVLFGIRAMMYVILPFSAAWSVVRAIRFEEESLRRVILMLYVVGGVVSVLSIATAVAPAAFAELLADPWKAEQESRRGFTTLGAAITTGTALSCIACVASGCLLAGYRRVLSLVVLVLCFLGVLTCLARTVMLAFIIGQLYIFLRFTKGLGRRAAILVATGVLLLVPLAYRFSQRYEYSLERFVSRTDPSVAARSIALQAAVRYGLTHPFVGGGWGLLYPYGRSVLGVRDLPPVWYVGEIATPVVKPHTLYGIVFAETGFPGLLVLPLFFWRIWRVLKPPDARLDLPANGLVAGFRGSFLCIALIAPFQDDLFLITKVAYVLYLASLTGIMANAYFRWRIGVRESARRLVPAVAGVQVQPVPALPTPVRG